jgi:hypothetical protein
MSILPLPLTQADRAAGYWWELSMRQIETSRTIVFDAPRQARRFFEALLVDNLDIGRPDHVELIFTGHRTRWGRPPRQQPTYKTRIDTRDTIGITVNADYAGCMNDLAGRVNGTGLITRTEGGPVCFYPFCARICRPAPPPTILTDMGET